MQYWRLLIGWRLLSVLDCLQSQVRPLVLLLLQALRLTVVGLGVRELSQRHRDVVQRQLLLPPVVSDDIKEPSLHLDLTVHDVCNTNIYKAGAGRDRLTS